MTLHSVCLWINKDKAGEHVRILDTFPTQDKAQAFLSQVDSDDYFIIEMDADEWLKVIEAGKSARDARDACAPQNNPKR